jgi:hypothetical protein
MDDFFSSAQTDPANPRNRAAMKQLRSLSLTAPVSFVIRPGRFSGITRVFSPSTSLLNNVVLKFMIQFILTFSTLVLRLLGRVCHAD